MDEKKPVKPQEITDDELGSVTGGDTTHVQDGKYYHYIGSSSSADWDASYLCPKCGRPVHYTSLGRFRCDACNESWWFEYKLDLNTESGLWEEISYWEYWEHGKVR